jgi:hypothetical protein
VPHIRIWIRRLHWWWRRWWRQVDVDVFFFNVWVLYSVFSDCFLCCGCNLVKNSSSLAWECQGTCAYFFMMPFLNRIPQCAFCARIPRDILLLFKVRVTSDELSTNITRPSIAIRTSHFVALKCQVSLHSAIKVQPRTPISLMKARRASSCGERSEIHCNESRQTFVTLGTSPHESPSLRA